MILTAEKVEHALILLGIPVDRIEVGPRGEEVYAHCPGHEARMGKPDRSASWSVNVEKLAHFCFSCGFSGSLVGLVQARRSMVTPWGLADYDGAKTWLIDTVGLDITALIDRLEDLRDSYIPFDKPVEMSEARLAVFSEPPDWALESRGLTRVAARTYGVKWADASESWITPVRWPESGKPMGWQVKSARSRQFKNLPPTMHKSSALFGLETYRGGDMIVMESPLDPVRVLSAGLTGGVSTYGSRISDEQFRLLKRADRLIFAMDNPRQDAAGLRACEQILEATRRLAFECWFFCYDRSDAKDPGDMTDREIVRSAERARHCVAGRRAFM